MICVGSSSVLWLVLRWVSFCWKISGENGQNWPFLQKSQVSTSTESRVPVLNVVFSLEDDEYQYLRLSTDTEG